MLTFQQYHPYDTAPYYAPCLPAALAYLPVFQNRGPLTLSQVSELASDYGRSADMRSVTYAVALLADAGYVQAQWCAPTPPPPAWHAWPAERGLAELVRCGLSQGLAAKIGPRCPDRTFATLAYEAEFGWPFTSLANIRGFGYGSYRAFCRAVGTWLASQAEGSRPCTP